jgi:hypothetical protein
MRGRRIDTGVVLHTGTQFVEPYLVPRGCPRGHVEYWVLGLLGGGENLLALFLVPLDCRDYEEHRP